ncbi:hypothetical protein NQ317_004921 [Molorchus minor]|uniref:Uncharacterized protein n=1 Tax=Molorchus minor TaxID=1323400 RepID=A0ABQ9JWG6_9CUCU|nr:hypothetical protein NQ317_004921 [Molorchus minor]
MCFYVCDWQGPKPRTLTATETCKKYNCPRFHAAWMKRINVCVIFIIMRVPTFTDKNIQHFMRQLVPQFQNIAIPKHQPLNTKSFYTNHYRFSALKFPNYSIFKGKSRISTITYSVANGSVTAKRNSTKIFDIASRLTTKRQYVLGINTKCYNRQTIFPKILSTSVNPATPRERRVQAHLELAELVEILARLLVVEIGHAIGFLLLWE